MSTYRVTILQAEQLTHDVKSFRVTRPENYQFIPGQATEVNLVEKGWEEEKRPFTFTGLPDASYLQFTIKGYPSHKGVTEKLHHLTIGDQLEIGDPWGAISYQGPGYFIAGGAGITPFLAIFRELHKEGRLQGNTLLFSNKTAADIILEQELKGMLGNHAVFILSQEKKEPYQYGRIDEAFLRKLQPNLHQHFYVCGPDPMVEQISGVLEGMGAKPDAVVFEK